jgi:hypothetical protein
MDKRPDMRPIEWQVPRGHGHNRFPVLWPFNKKERERYEQLGCPRSVPWSMVEACRLRIGCNHSQPIERLAERGGLDAVELAYGLRNRDLLQVMMGEHDLDECIEWLRFAVGEWEKANDET